MTFSLRLLACTLLLSFTAVAAPAAEPPAPEITRIAVDAATGRSAAVVVDRAGLVHTTQLLPLNGDGKLAGETAAEQIPAVLSALETILQAYDADRVQIVKLNLYVADPSVHAQVATALSEWFARKDLPAVSCVQTTLPHPGALLAADAVIAVAADATDKQSAAKHLRLPSLPGRARQSHATLLPPGDVVYIAGQAEPGDLAAATRATLESLVRTLRHMELDRQHIVSLKCFLTPMTDIATVDAEIDRFFGDAPVPPVAHVEWIAGGTRPIEIELVASAPHAEADSSVTYFTPPEMTSSPVYSRVARLHGNRRIYVSGLYADQAGDGAAQTRAIFDTLGNLLEQTGSDVRHLAKATYYVSDDDASSQLNALRPSIYDPQRPPAASKAMVRGVGTTDGTLTIDMIAAPAPRK